MTGYHDEFTGPGPSAADRWDEDPGVDPWSSAEASVSEQLGGYDQVGGYEEPGDEPYEELGYPGTEAFDDEYPSVEDPTADYVAARRSYSGSGSGRSGSGGRGGGGGRSRGTHRRRIVAGFGIVVVLAILVALGGLIYANHQVNPGGRLGPKVAVVIPAHASTAEIGDILGKAGVIHDGSLFRYYAKVTGASDLLPGSYRLAKNESYDDAINALQKGPVLIVDRLTIPEGFTLAQIAARVGALPGLHLSAAKFLAAGTTGEVRSPFEPKGVNNLEGLVFPATYQIRQGQVEADVLQEMVDAFDNNAAALKLDAGAKRLGMTPYQVITVASIVEREAKFDADRGDVASAIYNRLAKGMSLGADSTQTYYLRLTDPALVPTVAQLEEPSPYNTRLNVGLPPTPIANPGIPSLQAAIDPPATTYLYFVETNADGKLSFASDAAGFAQLQQECAAAKLC